MMLGFFDRTLNGTTFALSMYMKRINCTFIGVAIAAAALTIAPNNSMSTSQRPGIGRIYHPDTTTLANVNRGGIVIGTKFVLTAEHFIGSGYANKYFELLSNPGTYYSFVAIHKPPIDWYPPNWPYETNYPTPYSMDIAIVEFAENSFPSSIVTPIYEGSD